MGVATLVTGLQNLFFFICHFFLGISFLDTVQEVKGP